MSSAVMDRLDQDFQTVAAVCIQIRIPERHEAEWERLLRGLGAYSEQSRAEQGHIFYYVRPNAADHITRNVVLFGCSYGSVTLPYTPRGRQLAEHFRPQLRTSEVLKRGLVKTGVFEGHP